jgi:hypothetical protein
MQPDYLMFVVDLKWKRRKTTEISLQKSAEQWLNIFSLKGNNVKKIDDVNYIRW